MKEISYLCLTYGRIPLLEEAVQSFLQQDYDFDKIELILLNDNPWQTLRYDHPRIKVINLPKTFRFWGEKEAFGISQCSFDIVQQFDNDDIGLPNLSKTIDKYFAEGSHLMHWNRGIFLYGDEIAAIRCVGNSGIVFSKKGVELAGGYPCRNTGADTDFVRAIEINGGNVVRAYPDDSELCWCYSWGKGNSYHASGMGDDANRPEEEQIIERHKRFMEEQRAKGIEPEGIIRLNPHWKHDYTQMLKDFISKQNQNGIQ